MSSAVPAPPSPFVHGHLTLERQERRARNLLRGAHRHHGPAVLRLAARRRSQRQPFTLADARRAIAREQGFPDWASQSHHIRELEHSQPLYGLSPDGDEATLHLCGAMDLTPRLREAGFVGEILSLADPYSLGPLRNEPIPLFRQRRSRFLANLRQQDWQRVAREQQDIQDRLAEAARGRRVVLWFQHDSQDQLILARLLHQFSHDANGGRLQLIAVESVPGVKRFRCLTQLAPFVLNWLWRRRRAVSAAQLSLGEAAWRAVTANHPEALYRLSRHTTSALPMLGRALRRHLLELPDPATGLGLSEQLAAQLVAERGPISIRGLYNALQEEREPLPYLSPQMFRWVLKPLLEGERALLEYRRTPGRPWDEGLLDVTHAGHGVLSGYRNWLDSRPPIRWVGGIPIDGTHACWCIDKSSGQPRQR